MICICLIFLQYINQPNIFTFLKSTKPTFLWQKCANHEDENVFKLETTFTNSAIKAAHASVKETKPYKKNIRNEPDCTKITSKTFVF